MWDLRKNYSLYKKKPIPVEQIQYSGNSFTQGYTSIVRSPNSPYLFVSCQDNTIYQYNALAINNRPVNTYTGAKISSFFIKCSVSACGNYLASGSADNNLHIWNTVSGDPVATLGPQEETINCVTWHTKDNILASCTDDMRHRIWRPSFCDEVDRVKGRATMIKTPQKEILKETARSYPPSTPTSSGIRRLPATPDQADSRRLFTPDSRGRRRPGAAGAGHTPSIKAFLTPKNSLLRTPTRSQTTPNQNCTAGLTTTPLSAKNSQKRKLDLEDSSASKIIKLDSEVKDSLTDLINTNTSNVRISPTTFMSPSKKASALTPRKYQSPLKNPSSSKKSPTKSHFADRDSVRRPLTQIFSPTANLPNSVRDGTSPRHCCRRLHAAGVPHSSAAAALTPPQTQKSNWLRQLTEEKKKVESAKRKVNLEENVKGNTAKVKRRKSVRKLVLQKKP